MKMKTNTDDQTTMDRYCKKCGKPLRSTSKYDLCNNCRRKKIGVIKQVGGVVSAVVVTGVTIVANVLKKKS